MGKWENFTADRVTKADCPPGKQQRIYWDGKAPGLGLRVTAAGAKSYIFEAWLNRKSLRVTIGDARAWTVSKAQAEATRLKALTDQGIDPRELEAERQAAADAKKAEAERRNVTTADAWAAYLKDGKPKWSARHLLNLERLAHAGGKKRARGRRPGEADVTMPGPLFPLLNLRMPDIDRDAVRSWLELEVAKHPTWAAQAYRALRAFLGWAADQDAYKGIVTLDACNRRIARDVLPKAKPKTDSLQREQLPSWFAAVRQIANPVISVYLQTLLLIGSRREELAGLKWEDVDFRWQSITLHDKVEGERTIPLTPYVASLLSALPRRNRYVFSSPTAAAGYVAEPRLQHNRAQVVAGIEGLTLHGLRRSFKSLSEWVEMPVGIVAQVMGHKPSATAEKHYTVRPLDLLRLWHTKYEAWILEQAGVQQPQEGAEGLRLVASPKGKRIG